MSSAANVPADLRYTKEHEWLRIDGDVAVVGITAFAADALGDVVYVDLPAVGAAITAGETCGEVESTKSVSDVYAPVTGEVLETNAAVVDEPGLVNTAPFEDGWLLKVLITGGQDDLLDADAYAALLSDS